MAGERWLRTDWLLQGVMELAQAPLKEAIRSNPNVLLIYDEMNREDSTLMHQFMEDCTRFAARTLPVVCTYNPDSASHSDNWLRPLTNIPVIEMGEPDLLLILEVQLAAAGFAEHSELAHKAGGLIEWFKSNLNQSDFYDFGLRGLKGLVLAGTRYLNQCSSEVECLVRAIWASMLPQLSPADTARASQQLREVFPQHQLGSEDLLSQLPASVRKCLQKEDKRALEKLSGFLVSTELRHGLGLLSSCPHETLHTLSMCAHHIGRQIVYIGHSMVPGADTPEYL